MYSAIVCQQNFPKILKQFIKFKQRKSQLRWCLGNRSLGTVFAKHLADHQRHYAACRMFNPHLCVWKCCKTRLLCFTPRVFPLLIKSMNRFAVPDPCLDFICLNGGTCIDEQTPEEVNERDIVPHMLNFYCQCLPGFTGRRCESR